MVSCIPTHQRVDEPSWWRRARAGVLWQDDVEALVRPQELARPLQALRSVQKGPVPDAEFLFGLDSGKHRLVLGKEAVDITG